MKKKLLSLLLVLALVLALVPMTVFATEPNEAKIVNGSEYATLQEAVTAATDGQTIELLKNVTLTDNAYIKVDKTGVAITLDLKGHELKGDRSGSLSNKSGGLVSIENGTLSVKDSSTGKTGIIENTHPAEGTMSYMMGDPEISAVAVFNSANFVLESGTIKSVGNRFRYGYDGATALVLHSSHTGTVTINGGSIIGSGVGIENNGTGESLFVTGGEISGYYGIHATTAKTNITGGTIGGTYWGVIVNPSNKTDDTLLTISGENTVINQNVSVTNAKETISGGTINANVYAQKDSVVSITGGNIKGLQIKQNTNGQIQVSGGTFKVDPASYLLEGHTAPQVGDVWIVDYVAPSPVAQVGENTYMTLAEAVSAVSSAQTKTITLLADVADAGSVYLPAGATLDGANHKITGASGIYINKDGGTVQNVVFEDLHNSSTKQSAIYGIGLSGIATVIGCTFNGWDWDAVQITPIANAEISITGNTFNAKTGANVNRTVHIQSEKNVDFSATVTSNKFLGCTNLKNTGIEVYYPTDADKINCSGNYMDAPMGVCIGTGTSYNNAYAKAFPFKDESLENEVKIAAIIDRDNIYLYPTLQAAIDAAQNNETITLVSDIVFTDDDVHNVNNNDHIYSITGNKTITIDGNGHKITGNLTNEKVGQANGAYVFQITSTGTTNFKDLTILCADTNAGTVKGGLNFADNAGTSTVTNCVIKTSDLHHSNADWNVAAIVVNYAKVTVNGGEYYGGKVTTGGEDYQGINVDKTGSLTFNSGKTNGIKVEGGSATVAGGSATVTGGEHSKEVKAVSPGTLSLTGGTYYTEPNAKYIAKGYMKENVGNGAYVVKLATNQANKTVEEALEAVETAEGEGATDEQKAAAKEAVIEAVQAVENIENSTLAANSNTMDNLKALEEALTQQREADNTVGDITADKKDEATNITVNSVANAALSADLSVTEKDQKIEVKVENKTVEGESPAVTLDQINQAAQNKAKANVGEEKVVTAQPQGQETPTVVPLDITMVRLEKEVNAEDTAYQQVGEPITEPTAPVVMTFDLPTGWQNCEVIYVNDAGVASDEKIPTVISDKQDGGKEATATFSHFSTYVLVQTAAEANPNEYEIILTPNKTDVSAGDEITFTVKLKHTAGSSATFGYFRYAPAPEIADLLEYQSGSAESGVTYGKIGGTGAYEFAITGPKALANGATMTLGTLTYKVKAYATDNTAVNVVAKSGEEASITNSGYQMEAGLKLAQDTDVTYHVTTVTFTYGDGTSETKYVKYNTAGVYDSLDNMYNGTAGTVPTLEDNNKGNGSNGTQYRLLDTNWHLTTASGAAYDNSNSKFMANANYVVNRVELVEITIPSEVTVTENLVTTRGEGESAKTYVDKGADLTFTVSAPTLGNKKDVTVKVSDNAVDSSPASVTDATTTVTASGTNITGPVTFEITETVDLTAADIKIFTTGTQGGDDYAYLEYSVYSGTDTLVLIKGKTGASYTLGSGQPQIFAVPAGAYGEGYTHAVLVPKQSTVSPEAMLTYLTGTCGLTATTTANTEVTYDWNTNGQNGAKLADVQATYDFQSLDTLNWAPTDALLLKADVMNLPEESTASAYESGSYTAARDAHVSAADVNAFLYLYAQLAQSSN